MSEETPSPVAPAPEPLTLEQAVARRDQIATTLDPTNLAALRDEYHQLLGWIAATTSAAAPAAPASPNRAARRQTAKK